MTPGRPAPVVAHQRRPLLWLFVLGPILAFGAGVAAVDAERDERRRDRSVDVTGTLVDRRVGDGFARVRYFHPATEQELTVSIPVWDPGRLPSREGPVALDADPDDPGAVRLDGDVYPATGDLGWNLPYLAVPVLVWARRRWAARRTERLMASAGPSFAMLGAIAPAGWRNRRTELHLWPLDAAPGSPSLCRVGLLSTSHLPIGGTVFNIEVKGRPRTFGRLVARSADTGGVLWPAGAGLPRGARPRPAPAVVPAVLPAEVAAPPGGDRVRPPWAALALGGAGALLGALVLAAVIALVVRGSREDRHLREGPRVVAEVTGRDEATSRLAVVYTLGGERRTGRVEVTYAEDFPLGRRYPAHVDTENPSRLHLVRSRYDPIGPLAWGALPLLGALVGLGAAAGQWWRARRQARHGPWRPFEMWTGTEAAPWGTLVIPRTGQAVCSVQLGLPGAVSPAGSRQPLPALVAGDPQPGGRAVAHFDGATVIVHRTGAARRLRWWTS